MIEVKGEKLYVALGASKVRRRLKGHGFGIRKVYADGRNRAVIIHTATGEHLRELEAFFQDVLTRPTSEDGQEDTPRKQDGIKRKKPGRPTEEASYVCDACGEEIVIPVDLSAGESQEYVEDCPVCCRPNVIHVEIDEGGDVRVWAEGE